ncbi:transporter [Rhodomicrobium udaipurense JA643]|uniref:AEC family transporter n=1 Tax=Rhodomicrobium udaipurense TaxID=1202716 RepID=A0A8I1GHU7_9HYPH|nr:AEC family transporter [Rhodomicrobium udaipurense]KAI95945.1 transporter [Rhodomicrobium udaipurense JA643]MBJ7543785.1 AEC family transporter [Rhodomicrobium udaipurense]
MTAILEALAPLFLITALGYGLAQIRFGSEALWRALDTLVFYVLFPALLVKTLMRADLHNVPAADYVFVSVASVTIMAGALLAGWLSFGRPISGPAFTSFLQGAIRFQSIVSVAVASALFGERGLTFAALTVASVVPTVQLYSVLALSVFGEGAGEMNVRQALRRVMLNPLFLACVVGLTLNVTGAPDFAFQTLSLLGSASIGLTLLSVGAGFNMGAARAAMNLVAASTVLRLILMPLLVFGLSWLTGLTGIARTAAVIGAAVPTAASAYTTARIMGGDAPLMAQIVTVQSIASIATLPLFIWLAQNAP